jgi:hypothetical protein
LWRGIEGGCEGECALREDADVKGIPQSGVKTVEAGGEQW